MSELPDEVKKQLEAQKAQCLFCKIVRGELDAFKIYEDEHIMGILDINPAVKGHALFLPKEHYPILPLVPLATFAHMFSKIPVILSAMQTALVKTGSTVFIANGGAAGQQSPHFLIHVMPRENGDGVDFSFGTQGVVDDQKLQSATTMFAQNLPVMLAQHFKRAPAAWHTGVGTRSAELATLTPVIYEDEKTFVTVPKPALVAGHLRVMSKENAHDFTALSSTSSAHLFSVASYAASAAFEGFAAHGSNIILRSGVSGDTPQGAASIDVFARYTEDELNLRWEPMSEKPDLSSIRDKLHDALFSVANLLLTKEKPKEIIETVAPMESKDPLDEVRQAIAELHKLER